MTENRAQYNNQFGANEHLFTLISGIDPAKDHHSNISSIKGKLTKPELQVAVAYLKQNFTEKYTTQMNVFQIDSYQHKIICWPIEPIIQENKFQILIHLENLSI